MTVGQTWSRYAGGGIQYRELRRRFALTLLVATLVVPASVSAAVTSSDLPDDFTELSLEELMAVEISSVARRPQRFIEAAAAVHVLTAADIAASGATTIPDLLRLVPGVMVAQAGSNSFAVTARGFNSTSANKLQVLMDGRSLYTPLFSGVFWEVQNVPLDIIERIEIIRGPGAALWGANAVNGVINIITRPAAGTEGQLIELSAGTEERASAYFRSGGRGESTAYRVWLRYFDRDASELPAGGDAFDEWDMAQAGFRVDSTGGGARSWSLQGGAYDGGAMTESSIASPEPPFMTLRVSENRLSGGHLTGRWTRAGSDGGELSLSGYLEGSERDIPDFFGERRSTAEVELQHRLPRRGRHEVLWGAGYRVSRDDVAGSFTIAWDPAESTLGLASAFVQDEIHRADGRGSIILGAKLEHNDFTGFEFQPNIRGSWRPTDRRTLWGSLSRAVRTPSRLDHDAQINAAIDSGPPPVFFALVGNAGFAAETAVVVEIGFREQLTDTLSFDVAAFRSDYDNLLSIEDTEAPSFDEGVILLPFVLSNLLEGTSTGIELASAWQPGESAALRFGLTLYDLDLDLDPSSTDTFSLGAEDADPRSQAFLQGVFRPNGGFEWSGALRYVDGLRRSQVDDYIELDLRLAWAISDSMSLTLAGRNLLDESHLEFASGTLVERAVRGAVLWRF